jgi:threonine/homoserine/homoserine lactone efflux protein
MIESLSNSTMLLAFLAASFVLAATPGPGVLFIVTRTISQGRGAGLASVGGVALGNFGNALGASIGLAALFAISSTAFLVVKLAGACYLIYLGLTALRTKPAGATPKDVPNVQIVKIFKDGFWVALLNPKTAIFFAAFLPQFLESSASTMSQSVGLGAAFVLIAMCTDTAYVLAAATVAPALGRITRGVALGRYLVASIFIGLGLLTAFSGNRATK